MKVDTYRCDECGLQKGDNNHWFIASVDPRVVIWPWGDVNADGYLHLCSDACVIKEVQRWLSAQKEASQKGE